ncbi:hypothetical protein M8C21_005696, partial [Ambrosia artemisiifolia]
PSQPQLKGYKLWVVVFWQRLWCSGNVCGVPATLFAVDAVKLGAENKLSDAYDEAGDGVDDDGVVFKDPKVEDNIQAHCYINVRKRLHKVVPKVQSKFNGPIKVCILPFAFAIQ